jgi:hypothetical protein
MPIIGGIELNRRAIDYYGRHMPDVIIKSDLRSLVDNIGKRPKLFYSSHCIEHFDYESLVVFFRALRGILSRESVIFIEVPHASGGLKISKHVPHLLFFSEIGLSLFMKSMGFDVLFIKSVLGRSKRGVEFISQNYNHDFSGVPKKFIETIRRMRTGDWLAHKSAAVTKCIAKLS